MAYCSPAGINVRWQKWQQEKAHPRRFRAPTRRCSLSFQQKCAAFQSTVKSLPVFVWYSTNSNQRFPFLKGTHRFRHFVCILSLLSRMCHKLSWYNEVNRKANFLPSAAVPAQDPPPPKLLLKSRPDPENKVSLFAASLSLRQVLVVLESFPANGTEFWKPHPAQPMQLGTPKRVWLNSARILTGPVIRCCCCFVCCGRRGLSARSENARWGYPTQFQLWRNFPRNSNFVLASYVEWQSLVREMRFTRGTQRDFIWTTKLIVLFNLSQSWHNYILKKYIKTKEFRRD